jgi:DNA polymerase-1
MFWTNSYIYFYNRIKKTRRWSSPSNSPYKNSKLLAVMPDKFQKTYKTTPKKIQRVFEKENISADERRFAKTINFGVIYGMGAQKFARETGINQVDAKLFIERFNQRYDRVFAYLDKVKKEAVAYGYVETILGRRRYFEFTNNSLQQLKGSKLEDINLQKLKNLDPYNAGLLRAAANAPIQGSSADIIKIAMVQLHEVLKKYQARMLLQVHDELVFEIPPQEWEELRPQIKSVMENAVSLSVPLVVDIHAGDNWMETK